MVAREHGGGVAFGVVLRERISELARPWQSIAFRKFAGVNRSGTLLQMISGRSSSSRGRQFANTEDDLSLKMRANEPVLAEEFVIPLETSTLLACGVAHDVSLPAADDPSLSWLGGIDFDPSTAEGHVVVGMAKSRQPSIPEVPSAIEIVEGGSVEIRGPGTESVTFVGTTGTLVIDRSSGFAGTISGLAGSDAIDLADLSYTAAATATFLGTTSGGVLTVSNGTEAVQLNLQGNYLSSSWTLTSDGHGGTTVVDPVATGNWQTLKIGGGGWLTGMDIAPDNTIVVRTDTYGAYIWNGTQWQQLVTSTSMPSEFVAPASNSQGVYEIRIAPSNTNILYMAYMGNVFRSDNKGSTWTKTAFATVNEGTGDPYRYDGQKMAVDPNNPNVVYVGTPQNGLFVTTDGGLTWRNVNAVPVSTSDGNGNYPGIMGIAFDPTSGVSGGKTNTIYASSYGHGVYKSTNGGLSWSALTGGPSDVESAAISSAGVYYAIGNDNSSLWRFSGGTWTQLNPNVQNPHTVTVDPFNAAHVVVQGLGGGITQSSDGGATWSEYNWATNLSAADIPWLAKSGLYLSVGNTLFDQLTPNKLWASAGVGVWNTTLPQTITSDTPIVWTSQTVGIEQLVANEIVVPPGGHPVLASWDRPFFYVSDPNSYPSNYGVGNPSNFSAGWSVDYASSTPNFLVGINDWGGIEQSGYSSDGGQTWNLFPTMPSGGSFGGTIAASSPTDIVWAPANRVAPVFTKDGGLTWNPVVLPGVTDWQDFDWAYYLNKRTVTADRVLPSTFYLYYVSYSNIGSSGVYKTTDGGSTWTQVHVGEISASSCYNSRIESVPGQAGNLFFTGGALGGPTDTHPVGEGFYQSIDGGMTWTAVPNVLEVTTFGFGAPATPGGYPSIYIVGYVNSVYGIWQSNDDAKSWVQIGNYPNGDLDNIKTIAGDPNIYGQVYVGFGGSGYAYLPAAGTTSGPVLEGGGFNIAQPPLITSTNATLTHNQSVAASSLFTATDPNGQAITTYALKDLTGNGYFIVNGVPQATNVEINLTAAQLAQTIYQSGSGSDQIAVRASDGTAWSTWQTVTVSAPLDQAPLVTTSTKYLARNQTTAASALFSATDPDGDPITRYAFKDPTSYGYFKVNGVAQPSNTEIVLTADQLANAFYVAGSASEQLSVRVYDGTLWSAWQTISISVAPSNEKAPVVTPITTTTVAGQRFAASSLFSVSDPNNNPIVSYALKDSSGSGYFVLNGVVQAANTEILISAAQLAQTFFVAGSSTDQLSVRASDGWQWSTWQSPVVNVASSAVINANATLELASAYNGSVSFASTTGTLKIDNSSSFAGTVAGMTGSDGIDLMDMNFATIGTPTFSGTSSGGTLSISDGVHTANIALLGNYIASSFVATSDGHGGTLITDPAISSPVLGSPRGRNH